MNGTKMWWLSLGASTAVVGVVAVLLRQIAAAAQSVDGHAEDIWIAGKQIAGNTVSIWMLEQTNEHLASVAQSARAIEQRVGALDERLRALGGEGAQP